jgi:DNA-binding transcriptional LysR family regulator
MAELAHRAEADFPQIELIKGSIDEVTAWVMRGTADVGITSVMPSHPQFRQIRVFADSLVLCGSHARTRNIPNDVGWGDLEGYGPIVWEQSDLTPTVTAGLLAHRLDPNRLAHPKLRLSSSTAVLSALKGARYIGFVSERAASACFKAGLLERIGRLEIPVPYWMFSLRERDIDSLAAQTALAANALPTALRDKETSSRQIDVPPAN